MLLVPLIFVFVFLLFILIQKVLKRNHNYWKIRGVKYVEPLPLFGNMLPTVTQSLPEVIQYFYNAFPQERYLGIYQFLTPTLVIRDPDLIKSITVKHFDNFTDHSRYTSSHVDPLWGKNLFASKGERWRDLRQCLSPVFTSSKMRNMFVLMEECAKHLSDYLKKSNSEFMEVELNNIFGMYTNDIIASIALGIKCDSLESKENDIIAAGRELTDLSGFNMFKLFLLGNYPNFTKFFNIRIVSNRIGNLFKSVVTETIRLRETKNITRPDLIHLLMLMRNGKLKYEDSSNISEAAFSTITESKLLANNDSTSVFLTDEDITAQALVFYFGGFSTSLSLMCFAGYELAVNPQAQKKLKKEIVDTWLSNNGKISYQSLVNMKYLDMVLSETLRKWAQGVVLSRVCTKSFEIKPEREGERTLRINQGDAVMIPVYGIHRDPKYFPDPDTFEPERFSEENKHKIYNCTYIPFGSGPRYCIGARFAMLETKLLLYYILLEYDFVPTQKTQIPLKLQKHNLVPHAEKGFHLGLKRSKSLQLQCNDQF